MTTEAIEAVAQAICDETLTEYNDDPKRYDVIARAAIAAYQQAVAKDRVGLQYRYKIDDGEWSNWFGSSLHFPRATNITIETRDVFTAPPAMIATLNELAEENERLNKILNGCDWYWSEDDTSSDTCASSPLEIAENLGLPIGEVLGYSRGGIVETRYYGFLEAAEDADSDNLFEVDEATREEAEAKISTELYRRAMINAAPAPETKP